MNSSGVVRIGASEPIDLVRIGASVPSSAVIRIEASAPVPTHSIEEYAEDMNDIGGNDSGN